jgi:S1-C subfamily serine protease
MNVSPRARTTAGAAGAGIVAVTPGGPADRAGLRAGDVITSLGQLELAELPGR